MWRKNTLRISMAIFLSVGAYNAIAGCKINVFIKNTGNYSLDVSNFTSLTGVKTKMGVYRGLHKGYWFSSDDWVEVDAGARKGDDYAADFGCNKKRRYRIKYYCRGGAQNGSSFTKYYPSTSGWTEKQSLTIKVGKCK